ncbi:MAG: hypothetical protein ACLTFB_00855 [Candidatus Phytoplasma pyri]
MFFIVLGIFFLFIGWNVLTEMEIIKILKEEIPNLIETQFKEINNWYDDE